MDTYGNDSVGENSLTRYTEPKEEIRDPKNLTKFTIDTQSTYEKKKIVPNPAVQQEESPHKKRKLLRRSHHTICTIESHTIKLRNHYKMTHYISYVFGGFIQEEDGRLVPTNDLIQIVTKNLKYEGTGEPGPKPHINTTKADEAQITLVAEKTGVKPMPRRDHSAIMICNNKYMLVYGGKNDSAF